MSLEKWVWFYYNQGFSIIPLKEKDKRPNIDSWEKYHKQQATKEEIQTWLKNGLFKNIGVICGEVSNNLVVIDIDDEKIPKDIGLQLHKIAETGSWVVKTGKGYHIYCKHHSNPGGIKKPLKYKIEYRANRGYVVAPPSIHPNGNQYHFLEVKKKEDLPELQEKDVKSIFNQMKEQVGKAWNIKTPDKKKQTPTVDDKEKARGYPRCVEIALSKTTKPSMRYYTIYGIASSFAMNAIPKEMAMKRIKQFNMEKCSPPHENHIVEQAVNGAYKPDAKRYGCEFWIDQAETCPYENISECYYGHKKLKRELAQKYKIFKHQERKKKDGEKYFAKVGVKPIKLAELIINEYDFHFFTTDDTEEIYYYKNGVYHNKGEHITREISEDYMGELSSKHNKNEIEDHIRDKKYRPRKIFNAPVNLIPLKNGVYDINTDTLLPHSPKYYFLNQLPVDYDKKADCPMFKTFLQQICGKNGERRKIIEDTIQEYIGYTFYRAYTFKRYVLLDGSGDNGKTALMNVVKSVIGEENNTSVSLQDLNNQRFALAKLYGKLGNISDDLPDKAVKYTGAIKQITGNSPLWGDVKHSKEGISFCNYAKPWYGCNKLPEVYDWSDAFFGRMMQITFLNKFITTPDYDTIDNHTIFKADTNLTEKLIQELPGVLNYGLEGLHRLLENGEFSFEESTSRIREEYIKKTNPVHAYIEEECERTNADWGITKNDFYNEVMMYCERNGYDKPSSQNEVTNKVNDEAGDIYLKQRRVNGERVRVWIGIRSLTNTTVNQYFCEKKIIDNQEMIV